MAKKVTITKEFLMNEYSKFILENAKKPHTIFHFCQHLKIEERDFYQFFPSFEKIEEQVFDNFFENTIELLHKSDEYSNYDAKTKLLSFYFTYFELMTANRSLVLYLLETDKMKLQNLKKLASFRIHFKQFIDSLNIKTFEIPQETIQKIQEKSVSEASWIQFLMTLKFWIDDTSPSFEKTDVFIEKSIHASFDLLDLSPIKNIIDFGKFLWNEKVKM
jgi:hypothetical protein